MTPEQLAVLEAFFKHYLWLCDVFCVKPERHQEYLDMQDFLEKEKSNATPSRD